VRACARGKKEKKERIERDAGRRRRMRRKNWMKSFLHRDLRNKGTKIVGIQVQKKTKVLSKLSKKHNLIC